MGGLSGVGQDGVGVRLWGGRRDKDGKRRPWSLWSGGPDSLKPGAWAGPPARPQAVTREEQPCRGRGLPGWVPEGLWQAWGWSTWGSSPGGLMGSVRAAVTVSSRRPQSPTPSPMAVTGRCVPGEPSGPHPPNVQERGNRAVACGRRPHQQRPVLSQRFRIPDDSPALGLLMTIIIAQETSSGGGVRAPGPCEPRGPLCGPSSCSPRNRVTSNRFTRN